MKRMVILATMVIVALAILPAQHTRADTTDPVYVTIWEDANYGGTSRQVNINGENSVANLYNLTYSGPFGCHGDQWPDITWNDWHHCISSFIPQWNVPGCVQLWTGSHYAGGLIYNRIVFPGDGLPQADFTQASLGSYNDRAMSIRLGTWTGTRTTGHCVWVD